MVPCSDEVPSAAQRKEAVRGQVTAGSDRNPDSVSFRSVEREAYRPRGQPVLGLDGQPLDRHRRHRPPPRGRGGRRGGRPGGQLQHVEHGQVAVGLTPGEEAPAAHLDLVHRGGPPQQVHVDPAHLDARELHGTGRVPAARQPEVLQQQPQPARLEEPPRGPQLQGVAGLDRGGALLDQQRRRRFDLVRTVLGELQPLEGDGAGGADRVGVDRPPPLEGLARLGAAAQRVRADGVAGGPEVVEPDGERPELRLEPGRAGGVGEGHPGLDHIEQVERHPQPARLRLAGNGRRRWQSASPSSRSCTLSRPWASMAARKKGRVSRTSATPQNPWSSRQGASRTCSLSRRGAAAPSPRSATSSPFTSMVSVKGLTLTSATVTRRWSRALPSSCSASRSSLGATRKPSPRSRPPARRSPRCSSGVDATGTAARAARMGHLVHEDPCTAAARRRPNPV